MPNVFQELNDKYSAQFPSEEEFRIESKLLGSANAFNVVGRVVELYIPSALHAAVEIIGGSTDKSGTANNPLAARPDLMTDWRKPVEGLPQAPKDGILGRFRPSKGRF